MGFIILKFKSLH